MCLSGVKCLPTDCCFCELALLINPTKRIGLVQSRHHHLCHDLGEKLLTSRYITIAHSR